MSTAVMTNRLELDSIADGALKAATRCWFGVTVLGQLLFGFTVASFYGMTAVRGDLHRWSRFLTHGYLPGDAMGNLAVIMHVGSAVVLMLAGAAQLVPQVRSRYPIFHRWNGRLYMLAVVGVSTAGLFLTWLRKTVGDLQQHIGSTLGAVLILLCAAMALRYALARNFRMHRRWALRLFLAASGSWFLRLAFFLTLAVFRGPVGFDPATFTGWFLTFMTYAQYAVPLGVLELYFLAQDRAGWLRRMAMAGMLFVLSLAMVAGLFSVSMAIWVPQLRAAYDSRKSIAATLSATVASSGIDAAMRQYHELKVAQPVTYNFDESELNNLGYQFLRAKKFNEAIQILQLNVEAYPKSSNVYDSLGEAYLDDGNVPLAIVNYRKSLELNPKNRGAVVTLQKLKAM